MHNFIQTTVNNEVAVKPEISEFSRAISSANFSTSATSQKTDSDQRILQNADDCTGVSCCFSVLDQQAKTRKL